MHIYAQKNCGSNKYTLTIVFVHKEIVLAFLLQSTHNFIIYKKNNNGKQAFEAIIVRVFIVSYIVLQVNKNRYVKKFTWKLHKDLEYTNYMTYSIVLKVK